MASTTAQKASRHLATVTPAQVEAMNADTLGYPAHLGYAAPIAGEYLAGLLTLIYGITKDDDVREHASIIVASLVPHAASGMHAARAAVRIATRAVALARSLDSWDTYGDMTEERHGGLTLEDVAHGEVRHTGLTRYAPDPAARYAATYGDLVATVLATSDDETLRAACQAYREHARGCQKCTDASTHTVTLAGVRQHVDGLTADDSRYHSERRAVLKALARVGTFTDLARVIDDPAPMAPAHTPHGSVSLGSIRKASTRDQVAPVRTVHTREGVRAMTAQEVAGLARTPGDAMARHDGEEYRGGTHGAISGQADTFGHASPVRGTGAAVTPGQALPSGKVEPSPRKRPRTGSTGPTVPVGR